jgi:hypothetical protein
LGPIPNPQSPNPNPQDLVMSLNSKLISHLNLKNYKK